MLAIWFLRPTAEPPARPPGAPPTADAFVRAEGPQLVRNGAAFRLKSINFSNHYTLDLGEHGFRLARSKHHSERDFERVVELGFNAVRFAFNGNWYRDDPRAFWRWLDRNVGWAEAHGVLLTLDLHVPIGGSWLDPSDDDGDFRIWTDPRIRSQNIGLWRQIAKRYSDVPTIAAYDLLNEAVTADKTGAQWRRLAGDMASAIREVDTNHLLVVGALYGVDRTYTAFGEEFQFLIDDDNVLYDFHFYEPVEFTHQSADWLERPIVDGGIYPDPDRISPTGAQVLLTESRIESPRLPPGRSDWRRYESGWREVSDRTAVAGLPTAILRSGVRGNVHFDDLAVFEHDPVSGSTRQIVSAPLSASDIWDWWSWGSADAARNRQVFTRSETAGANDDYSLGIDGRVGADEYLGWSSDSHWFKVTPGRSYKITGQMKGEGVAYSDTDAGFAGLSLDLYAHPSGQDDGGFLARDRDYLQVRFLELLRFGQVNDVPMSVMEFGTIRGTFDAREKGGGQWVADMLDIFDAHGVSYALWNYHGPSMGMYLSAYGSAPAEPNLALIEVVREHLADPAAKTAADAAAKR